MNKVSVKIISEITGATDRTVRRWITSEGWPVPSDVETTSQGGRPTPFWFVDVLPEAWKVSGKVLNIKALAERFFIKPSTAHTRPAAKKTTVEEVASAFNEGQSVTLRGLVRRKSGDKELTDIERERRDASLIVAVALDGVIAATGQTRRKAGFTLAQQLIDGVAEPHVIEAMAKTYVKPRLKPRQEVGIEGIAGRIDRLYALYDKGRLVGDPCAFLVPARANQVGHNPVWEKTLLRHYCKPSRPTVKMAYESMVSELTCNGIDVPSYATAKRIIQTLPITTKNRGRMTGSELSSIMEYVKRDVSMFYANDFWVCDGHTFKAKVQHPIHGQPFQPELTVVIDWVSRKIVGWSVGLSESTVAVSDAFRHAQLVTRARPLIYYTDNGGGQTNKVFDHPIHGTLTRQGIEHKTGIPGNPQARGIIERLWQSTAIPLAQTYPTCLWRGADQNSVRKMLQLVGNKGGADRCPTWQEFISHIEIVVSAYNLDRAHSSLGGKTPEDVYQERLDKNSIVFGVSDEEIHALWMPQVSRRPNRGVVRLLGNEYFCKELVHGVAEGESVNVRYDIHDANKVMVYRTTGEFIAEAVWNGHAVAAFPVSMVEDARIKRMNRKIKRGEAIIAEAQAENSLLLEATPADPVLNFSDVVRELVPAPIEPYEEEMDGEMSHQDLIQKLYGGVR